MKAAVIGLGPHGLRIVRALSQVPGVELAAVVDRSEQALAAEMPPGVARYRSDSELWSRGDVMLACIATNGPSHAPLALAAMTGGARFLLVEKPMACSLAECDQIICKAETTQTRVAVGHTSRYAPSYRWLRERISSGDWGQVRAIWIQRPGIGLGCNATHSFDLVTYLAGRRVEQVTAWVDEPLGENPRGSQFVDPGGLVVMELAGGARGIVAQIEDGAGPMCVEIDMTAARIRMDEKNDNLEVLVRDLSVKKGPNKPAVYQAIELPNGVSAKSDMISLTRDCLTDLVAGRPLLSGTHEGCASIEVLVAAHLSHRRGHARQSLPLETREELELWLPVT